MAALCEREPDNQNVCCSPPPTSARPAPSRALPQPHLRVRRRAVGRLDARAQLAHLHGGADVLQREGRVAAAHRLGLKFTSTINANLPDPGTGMLGAPTNSFTVGRCENIDGKPLKK